MLKTSVPLGNLDKHLRKNTNSIGVIPRIVKRKLLPNSYEGNITLIAEPKYVGVNIMNIDCIYYLEVFKIYRKKIYDNNSTKSKKESKGK